MRSFLLVLLTCVFMSGLLAQDELKDTTTAKIEQKFGIQFRKMFLDHQTFYGGNFSNFSAYTSGYELAGKYRFDNNLTAVVPLRFGVASFAENLETLEPGRTLRTISIDGQIHYSLVPENKLWQPSIYAGLSVLHMEQEGADFQIPVGLSISFPFTQRASIDWHSEFRKSFSENGDNFQHGVGFTYWFGGKSSRDEIEPDVPDESKALKDSDGDGVPDDLDLCPHVAGPPEYFGCPDSDGDGIHDLKDKCPAIPGLKEFNGCPDADNDGVPDNEDECPNMKGTIANNGCPEKDSDGDGVVDEEDDCPNEAGSKLTRGCPDSDNDGVADKDDKCPKVPGTKANNGCPEVQATDSDGDGVVDAEDACPFAAGPAKYKGCPDSDGDGIPDPDDDCPFAAGIEANNGCPEIKKEDRDLLELAMRAVQFDLGKATLRPESFKILDQISSILSRYKDYNLSISGHTDNTGNPLTNQRLSENRAKSCYEYLISKGVNPSRLSYAGYGESVPIADNQSAEGRSLNRRVEFTLVPRRR